MFVASDLTSKIAVRTATWSGSLGTLDPVVNRLYLATVVQYGANGLATPSVSGCGLSWVLEDSYTLAHGATVSLRVSLFRALKPSGLSAGGVSVSFGAGILGSGAFLVDEVANVNTSGTDGSGAVIQSVPGGIWPGGALTIDLAALSGGAPYAAFGSLFNTVYQKPGWTKVGLTTPASGSPSAMSEWNLSSDPAAYAYVGGSTYPLAGVALELRAAPVTVQIGQALESDAAQSQRAIFHGRVPVLGTQESDEALAITPVHSGTPPRRILTPLTVSPDTPTTLTSPGEGGSDLSVVPFTDPC